jgi:hypothetical protein
MLDLRPEMKLIFATSLCLFLVPISGTALRGANGEQVTERTLAQPAGEKAQKDPKPLSEIQFHITDTSLGKVRLIPVQVKETLIPLPGSCQAVDGGKEIEGKFRLEFEMEGNHLATYFLDLTFVEGHFWDSRLKRSKVPLAGQSREQIVIIQYGTCSTIKALIFGYDLKEKKIVRYSFRDSDPWRVSLSAETRVLPDGTVEILTAGKPDGVLQRRTTSNVVWGTFLRRYLFDPPTRQFFDIPMVVGMRVHRDPAPPREIVLYQDGYLTDLQGREKFVPKIEVSKLLISDAAEGILKLREQSGHWERDFGYDPPLHDFFFDINDKVFAARCGQTSCPNEIRFIRDKLLQFWGEDRRK